MNLKNIKKLMKQAQDAQENLMRELKQTEVSASAGGDMVTVRMNGAKELLSIKIDPEVVDKDDVEMLEDLVTAAIKEAQRRADEAAQGKMGAMGAGLGLPGF
jgi:DNA-binding YbaB/EbfC family protein